jgi:tetratricopeptide (TPR) repeat protein
MRHDNELERQLALGDSLYERDEFEGARLAYERAIEIKPDSPEAAGRLAKVLLGEGAFSDAKELYEAAMNNGLVKSAENLANLGICYAFEGEGATARTLLEGAVAVDATYEPAIGALARHCLIMTDFEAADRYATEGLRRFPRNVPCMEARALARLAKMDFQRAEADALKLLSMDRDSVDGRLCLAGVHLVNMRCAEAISILREAEQLDPTNDEVFLVLGSAYQSDGQLAEADSCYREAKSLAPMNWRVYQALAGLDFDREQWEQGLRHVDLALELNDAPILHQLRGSFLTRVGDDRSAVAEFKNSTSANPLDAISWVSMAEIEIRDSSSRVSARQHAHRALELSPDGPVAERAQRVLSL